jgi:ribosomal protein S12 methylthiotransferase accessory factor
VQVRTTYIVGSREDIRYLDYRRDTLEGRNRSVRALMRPVDRSRDFASVPSRVFPDFKAEVAWILERLRGVPIRQAIAVDLTRSAFGVAVARVVVPGLEGSDHLPDYAPGARARALAWAPK